MPTQQIPYSKTGYFSKLICDYLDEKEELKPFYNRFPNLENFREQIDEKTFPESHRSILVSELRKQYANLQLSPAVGDALDLLEKPNAYTITTGHQLNLFTGPLYFLYKIISTIRLSRKLKEIYPDQEFVPVYWMATEDHDFDEINYFRLRGKKVKWNRPDISDNNKGAVGELSPEGLEAVHLSICLEFGGSRVGKELCDLFNEAYLGHKNLADATRFLANRLFGDYGLVIVDGNSRELKKLFVPYMKDELIHSVSHEAVQSQADKLDANGYPVQVNPRDINLFYLDNQLRERIINRDKRFYVHDTELEFSENDFLNMLHETPEKFSPNVITRPLYQEVILPNLAYIGGGGELAYWLQLKTYFKKVGVAFPMLVLRNSALLMTEKQLEKAGKLDLAILDLFLEQNDLVNRKIRKISNIDVDFSPQKNHLQQQFEELYSLAEKTDKSFLGAVKAQEVKQLKGLEALEKRLLLAQKKKLSDHVNRLASLQDQLFPDQSLQERVMNFSEFYLEYGEKLIPDLFEALDPLDYRFTVLIL